MQGPGHVDHPVRPSWPPASQGLRLQQEGSDHAGSGGGQARGSPEALIALAVRVAGMAQVLRFLPLSSAVSLNNVCEGCE